MLCEYPPSVEGWTNERAEYEMDLVESTVKWYQLLQSAQMKWQKWEIMSLASLSSLNVFLSGTNGAPAGCQPYNLSEGGSRESLMQKQSEKS
ncbi:hypothetical protein Ddye_022039 [Dipteronia dyeriana]|uniref:Uncharacterized protein n=1 Tax=Dipteronia dyeriana TaxID=168575 RepID=A0AAD9WWV9_9ROSI|nr:hypothetical protein Ddye_022039 [Dipteronia dyeriana]